MNKNIKKLELRKLFKEFGFLKIDEEYKVEIQNTYGPEFSRAVQDLFKKKPDLNILYNNSAQPSTTITSQENRTLGIELYQPQNNTVNTNLELYTGQTKDFFSHEIKEETTKSDIIKKLYRKIATKTHPDKVSLKFLNDLYIKAKNAYNKNDLFTIYLICNDLDIEYEFPEEEFSNFKLTIKNLKNQNTFIEQTYLWAWANEENEGIRNSILLHYISNAYGKH